MAENEVAHAGIGADIQLNGLDKLLKASSFMDKLRDNAEKMRNITSNIAIHIENKPELDELRRQVADSKHDTNVDVNVHANGEDNLARMREQLNDTRESVNSLKHSMDINTNTIGGHGVNSLNESVRHLTDTMHNLGDNVHTSLDKIGASAEDATPKVKSLASSGHSIRDVFVGTALGGAISNAFGSIKSGAESAIKSGIKLVSVGRDTERAWRNIGLSQNQSNSMTEQMDNIRDKAGMDEQSINQMQKSFYSLTGSAPKAQALTNELVSFGKATGESDQQISKMGMTLPRMLSTGKVSGQMFNRTFRQSPALINAIAKASGHTTGQFRQLAANGKVTSAQLEQYMEKAAKNSGNAWKEYTTTFQGQLNVINGTWTRAKENFARPFVNNLTKTINETTKNSGGLLEVQKSVGQISSLLGKRVGNWSGKAIGWITKNQRPLIHIGKELFLIASEIGKGAWKEFSSILRGITGDSRKTGNGLHQLDFDLTDLANHSSQLAKLGKVLVDVFMISRVHKFDNALIKTFHSLTKFKIINSLQRGMRNLNSKWQDSTRLSTHFKNGINNIAHSIRGARIRLQSFKLETVAMSETQRAATIGTKAFSLSIRGIGSAIRSVPIIGWIQIAIDGITLIYTHSAKFRALVNPLLKGIGRMIGWIGDKIADGIEYMAKFAKGVGNVFSKVTHFFHGTTANAKSTSSSMNRYTRNSSAVYNRAQKSNTRATARSHTAIDKYRRKSSGKFVAYMNKNGRIYRSYHKGTVRISQRTLAERENLRRAYYRRYQSQLSKYEKNYRSYETKRSSLSRRYGKLRAMYSIRSLKLIENRFKRLRTLVVRYARTMFTQTQHWFKRLGTGAGRQFRGIYNDIRRWLRRGNREAVRDFKELENNSKRYLNGSITKYVRALRYRYKKQRYYDNQLLRQAKRTNQSMYKIPLGWISRETRMLIRNWKHQRSSFITHNERMTRAERTHLQTMTDHLKTFGDNFKKVMSDLESSIYDSWSKFWDKMHNRTGSGINAVQSPLNSGAMHINSFVRSFGETSAPMHEMPSVSYAIGTGAFSGIRRPITQLTDAILNDGHDSPETNNQETVVHPDGQLEFPQGSNVHETLEPGTEVLNATETKLMSEMAHFAPTVHFATGTGLFGDLFGRMSAWIKSALNGTNQGMDYSSAYTQAKGTGNNKLLHVLQTVLKHSTQILSGFMGNAPSGFNGVLGDITKGIYGQTSNQIDQWWQVLMKLTDQALNNGASSSEILNYAEKHWMGIPYVYGATAHSGADCGGAVQSILSHFGINISHTDMEDSPAVRYVGSSESDARPGDLVMFGKRSGSKSGATSHVGIYSGHGQMWNECPPKSTISSVKAAADADGLWGFYRLRHAPSNNNDSLSDIKTNNPLGGFVKKQEAPMFKWIEKHLAPLLDPDPGGGPGVAKWRSVIEQAAEKMGVHLTDAGLHKVMSNIQHESGGDEKVTQSSGVHDINSAEGDPAKGLVQFIPPTFNHYAVAGHNNILSGYDQLLALFNDSNWFSDIAPGGGWAPSGSRRRAAGGHLNAGEMSVVGEEGSELFKPDVSGTVIPHNDTHRIINNNTSKRPITVHNTVNVTVKGGNKQTAQSAENGTERGLNNVMRNWVEKMNRQAGNVEGGAVF